MQVFEYRVQMIPLMTGARSLESLASALNNLGAESWALTAAIAQQDFCGAPKILAIFKRGRDASEFFAQLDAQEPSTLEKI